MQTSMLKHLTGWGKEEWHYRIKRKKSQCNIFKAKVKDPMQPAILTWISLLKYTDTW